jgi:hypothetical protein
MFCLHQSLFGLVEGAKDIARPESEKRCLVRSARSPHMRHGLDKIGCYDAGVGSLPVSEHVVRDDPFVASEVNRNYRALQRLRGHPFHEAVIEGAMGINEKKAAFAFRPVQDVLPDKML